MSQIRFTVPVVPQGKQRPRIVRVGGQLRMATPAKTVAYETSVAYAAQDAMQGRPPLTVAVSVEIDICCPIPASWSLKKQRLASAGELWPTTKPDMDNVIKAIYDGMNGVVLRDDVQVCVGSQRKLYSQMPRVVVTVTPLDEVTP